jgi:hypothetical protein
MFRDLSRGFDFAAYETKRNSTLTRVAIKVYTLDTLMYLSTCHMTTRFVGIKEFRQHMAVISETARKKKQRLIIVRNNKPIFELRPLDAKTTGIEKLLKDIEKARDSVKKGKTYTLEQVEKMLGL